MEERVKNVEGAIILLTDMLNKQDGILARQDEMIARLDKRGEEQQKMLARLESNQIIFSAQNKELEGTMNNLSKTLDSYVKETRDFMKETKGLFIRAGEELRDHEERIEKLEDNK